MFISEDIGALPRGAGADLIRRVCLLCVLPYSHRVRLSCSHALIDMSKLQRRWWKTSGRKCRGPLKLGKIREPQSLGGYDLVAQPGYVGVTGRYFSRGQKPIFSNQRVYVGGIRYTGPRGPRFAADQTRVVGADFGHTGPTDTKL